MLSPKKQIKNAPIRIALVGCGRISKNHISALLNLQDRCQLVALCDSDGEKINEIIRYLETLYLEKKLKKTSPLIFNDYKDLLLKGNKIIDLVILATPSGLHSQQTILAAQKGIHICTEKPMATRWDDGIKMIKECDLAGVHLFVVKQNRFNKTLQLLKRQLDAGRFGKLIMVTVNVFWQRPQQYYDQDKWRGTWEFDGGALMNQASHYIDLLDWLIGPVETISASTTTLGRNIEVEDTAAIQLKWRNGALGTMAVTMLTFPKNLEGSITILGENGTVKIGGKAVNKIEHWEFADEAEDDKKIKEINYEPANIYGNGHTPYFSNIFDALEGKDEAICDGRQGIRSLELIIGAYRSAQTREVISLPLNS